MKTPSSANLFSSFTFRLAIASLAAIILLLGFGTASVLRAETPPDQIKAAGAIPLSSDLLDKMDKALKSLSADEAAKAEMAVIGKDPSLTPETWAAAISSKCPKSAAIFKSAGLTPDEFAKGIFAIMACAMSEDLAKSDDKTVKANAEFVNANKDRANAVFAGFLGLSGPPDPASSPATTP